jgi:hypothetical protein
MKIHLRPISPSNNTILSATHGKLADRLYMVVSQYIGSASCDPLRLYVTFPGGAKHL